MTLDHVWGCSWCHVCLISLKFSDNVGMILFFIWYFLKKILRWTSSPQIAHFKCLKTLETPCRWISCDTSTHLKLCPKLNLQNFKTIPSQNVRTFGKISTPAFWTNVHWFIPIDTRICFCLCFLTCPRISVTGHQTWHQITQIMYMSRLVYVIG